MTNNPAKRIITIAGPNGAGKTTLAMELLPNEAECPTFINADLLAAGLNPLQSGFVGYICWSLLRASWVENRQSMTDLAALRSLSSAATSRRSSGSSLIRRSRHALLKTLNSISAMFSQLP